MSKNPVPESVRESWARIRFGAKVAVEQGARAIRLLVGPNVRIPPEGAPPVSERVWIGTPPGDAGPASSRPPPSGVAPVSSANPLSSIPPSVPSSVPPTIPSSGPSSVPPTIPSSIPPADAPPASTRGAVQSDALGPASTRGESRPPSSRQLERAQYKRIQTPAFFRPAGLKPFLHLSNGESGEARLRMYSDAHHACGEHLKLELIFPNGEDRSLIAEVAWVDALPPDAPARYDVGLRVRDLDGATRLLIASVLAAQEP